MLKKQKMSVRISLIIGSLLLVLLSLLGFITLNQVKLSSYEAAISEATACSVGAAKEIELNLENARDYLNQLASFIQIQLTAEQQDRSAVITFLETGVMDSDFVSGTWFATEPDGFGGRDSQYIGTLGSDLMGRFSPYIVKVEGKVILEESWEYEMDMSSDYYTLPKKNNEITLIPPYLDDVQGKAVLMVSLAKPIYDNSRKFIGVAGIDINMNKLQNLIAATGISGGFSALLSETNTILAHGDKIELIGKNLTEYDAKSLDALKKVNEGETVYYSAYAADSDIESLKVFTPITMPGQEEKWAFVSLIMKKDVLKDYYQLSKTILFMILAIIIILVVAISTDVLWMLKPLVVLSKYIEKIEIK